MQLRKHILKNPVVNSYYKFKFYTGIAMNEISWITSKLPQLVSIGVLFYWLNITIPRETLPLIIIGIMVGLNIFGFYWKKYGFYDTDMYITANRNPIQNELLLAARIIRSRFKISDEEMKELKEEIKDGSKYNW